MGIIRHRVFEIPYFSVRKVRDWGCGAGLVCPAWLRLGWAVLGRAELVSAELGWAGLGC